MRLRNRILAKGSDKWKTAGCMGVLIWLLTLGIAAADFHQSVAEWQQVDKDFGVVLGLEREVFELSDGVGRFVIALQVGKKGEPSDFEASWKVQSKDKVIAEGSGSLGNGMLVVDFALLDLGVGTYEVSTVVTGTEGEVAKESRAFEIAPSSRPEQKQVGRVPLVFPSGVPATVSGYPLTFGVPFPPTVLSDLSKLRVVDEKGKEIPAQFQTTTSWSTDPKAGVRWLSVDLQLPETASWWPERKATPLFLEYGKTEAKAQLVTPLQLQKEASGIRVHTGPLQFLVRSDGFNLLDEVTLNGKEVLNQGGKGGAYLIDQNNEVYRAVNDRKPKVEIEESGPLRAVIRVEGWYVREGSTGEEKGLHVPTDMLCKFITRIEAYAGLPWVRVQHTWIQTADSFTVFYNDIGLSLLRAGNAKVSFGVEGGSAVDATTDKGGVYLLQHLPDRFDVKGEDGKLLSQGEKSDGSVRVATKEGDVVAIAHRETWQRFPKEMEVLPDEIRFHIWPAHGVDHPDIDPFSKENNHRIWFAHQGKLLDLRFPWKTLFGVMTYTENPSIGIYKPGGTAMGGVQSSALGIAITSDFIIRFGTEDKMQETQQDVAAFLARPGAGAEPNWVADSGAMGPISAYHPEQFQALEDAAEGAIIGMWDLQNATGEYGMFLYRVWHHSTYDGQGFWWPYRLYSAGHHYDPYLPWLYYARSGNPMYYEIGMASMRQLTDIGITHYNNPEYPFKEFWSEQPKLVGATGHTNGFVLWGGDHAILDHQTSYGAMILAYYLSGDLRFREVVEKEWQFTLLDDRLNPGWSRAARMNWGKNVSQTINRDNNQALSEMQDLYRLTWDPRLIAMMQPCVDSMEQNMYSWALSLENVLDFRRTPKLKSQLKEAAEAHRKDPHSNLYHAFNSSSAGFSYALAAWMHPEEGFEKDALWWVYHSNFLNLGKEAWAIDKKSPAAYQIPDAFLRMPTILRTIASLQKTHAPGSITLPQWLPITSGKGTKNPTMIVIREDDDQEIVLHFGSEIASPDARVIVFGPGGEEMMEVPLTSGENSVLKIPKDGATGDYRIVAHLDPEKDKILLPISSLQKEVYVTSAWTLRAPNCFYIGVPNGENGMLELGKGMNGYKIEGVNDFKVLGVRVYAEDREATFSCPLPEDGAWLTVTAGKYYLSAPNKPVILSLDPSRFFKPNALSIEQ